jgi:hypothetical protein
LEAARSAPHARGCSAAPLAEQLGFSPIPLGRIDEGGRLLHIPGPLVLHNLVDPLK